MDVALVEDTQHDVDGHQGRKNQIGLARQRILKGGRSSLKAGVDAGRQIDIVLGLIDGLRGLPEGNARGQVERNGHNRELALVIDRE